MSSFLPKLSIDSIHKTKKSNISVELLDIVNQRAESFLATSACVKHGPEEFREFLEDFVDVYYLITAVTAKYPILKATMQIQNTKILDHACKELDKVLSHGHILIRLHHDENYKEKYLKFFLRVVYVACNYNIGRFIAHPVVQSILTTHGMKTIGEDIIHAMIGVFVYIFYPIFYMTSYPSSC